MQLRKQVETIISATSKGGAGSGNHGHAGVKGRRGGSAPQGQAGGGTSDSLDSKDNLSTKRPDKLPPLKEGDNVVIDGRSGVITKIATRINQRSIPADKLGDPSTSKPYKTTSIQISGSGAQLSTHRFGGLDYEITQDRAARAQTKNVGTTTGKAYDSYQKELEKKLKDEINRFDDLGQSYPNTSSSLKARLTSEELRGIKEAKALIDNPRGLQGRIDDINSSIENLDTKIHHPHRTDLQRRNDKKRIEELRAVRSGLTRVRDEENKK